MTINGNDYVVEIDITDSNKADVKVNGAKYHVELADAKMKKDVSSRPQVAAVPSSHPVPNSATPAAGVGRPAQVSAGAGSKSILSPLPGVVLDLKVAVGDTVAAGQTVAVLEAMKMENNIDSSFSGVVKSIAAKTGASVLEGDVLITIE